MTELHFSLLWNNLEMSSLGASPRFLEFVASASFWPKVPAGVPATIPTLPLAGEEARGRRLCPSLQRQTKATV